MSYHRVLNSVLQLHKTSVIAKRNVSEYAKRFGYKIKMPDKEVKVKPLKNLFYFAGAGLLFADMALDKQKHYETFIKHFDETKKYYKPENHVGFLAAPDMSFLIEDSELDHQYKDDDCIPVTKIKVWPDGKV